MEDEPPSFSLFFTEDSLPISSELDLAEIENSANALLKLVNHDRSWNAGIKLVDGPTMAQLHGEFMNDPTETDVMSFEAEEEDLEEGYLGDLIVCQSVAEHESKNRTHSSEDELYFYILHGLLHLLGYDDDTDEKRTHMLKLQAQALESIGRVIEL